MRKQKLFLPIVLAIIALLLGTSLAFGIAGNGTGSELKDDLAENGSLLEHLTAEDIEQEVDVQDTDEEADEPDEIDIEESTDANEVQEIEEVDENEVIEEEVKAENEKKSQEPQKEKKPAVAVEEPAGQPVKDNQMARVTASGLNVRPGPSTDDERIDVLLQGQTVKVLAELNDWLQVELTDGRTGWISAAHVNRFTASSGGGGSLAGRVIAIDPGHGGTDPGAVGVTGLPEKDVVLDVAQRVAEQLRAQGAEVIMTRDTDVFIPLGQRVSIAEATRAEVYVSIHANAHPNPGIGGIETYYTGNKPSSSASFTLASHMQQQLVGALGLRDIGVKNANFLVIRQTSMPSVLLELGFLSNSHEESLMRTNEFRQNSADAIVRGLQNYFN